MEEKIVKSFNWLGHHVHIRSVFIEGIIENFEPLRVGSGREATKLSPIDLPIVKIYDPNRKSEIPLIPGSSWKGVFRSSAYRICKSHGLRNVCAGLPRASCLKGGEFSNIEESRTLNEVEKKIKALIYGRVGNKWVCLLCLIFGTPGILSHVFFEDSFTMGEFKLGYRTCVAIDRRIGAALPRSLYTLEYVEPGAKFGFKLVATNLPNYALGLLGEVIREVQGGLVKIGGSKSRGFGRVRFVNLKIAVEAFDATKGVLNGVLQPLDPIDVPVKWPSEESSVEGEDAWRAIDGLIGAWKSALDKLRRVSEERWNWSVVL